MRPVSTIPKPTPEGADEPAVDLRAWARREKTYPADVLGLAVLGYVGDQIGQWVAHTLPAVTNNKERIDRLFDDGILGKLNKTIGRTIEPSLRRIGITDEQIKQLKQGDAGMLYAWVALSNIAEPVQDHLDRGTPPGRLITIPPPEELLDEAAGEALHEGNARMRVTPQAPRKVTAQGPRRVQQPSLALDAHRQDKARQYLQDARKARSYPNAKDGHEKGRWGASVQRHQRIW